MTTKVELAFRETNKKSKLGYIDDDNADYLEDL